MNNYYPITEVKARQILDSRGNPTIEAEDVYKRQPLHSFLPSQFSFLMRHKVI